MDWTLVAYFIGASILLTLAPGPDILFVAAQGVTNGRKAGIVTALGLSTGVLGHTTAAALGVSALLLHSAFAFQVVKYAGAAYLLYLAWQAWREGAGSLTLEKPPQLPALTLYRRGVLMNLLNPKVSLFFLALLPQFVSVNGMSPWKQMLILGFIFMLLSAVIFSIVAVIAGMAGGKLSASPRAMRWVNKGKAVLYALIGLRIALAQR